MKKILTLIFTFLLIFTMLSCGKKDENDVVNYTVSFSTNGGSVLTDMTVEGSQTNVSVPTPEKEGFEFLGWFTDMRLSQPWDGSVSADLVLYAKWKTLQYVLSFETNGGEEIESLNLKFNDTIGRLPVPTKEGHTFGGWFLDEALTEKYSATEMPSMPSRDVKLYAKWTINTYLVQFLKDDLLVHSVELAYNSTVAEITDTEVITKVGHTFLGWYNGDSKFDFTSPVTSDLDLVAKYERNKYKVNFDVDGVVTTKEFYFGTSIELITNPTKEGYTFAGWEYSGEIPTTMPDHDFTLKATWTLNVHDLVLNYNSEDGKVTQQVAYGTALNVPTNPVKVGYEFAGWYTDVACTTQLAITTMPDKTLNLYAKWSPINFTVKFDKNGGEGSMDSQSFTYDKSQNLYVNKFSKVGHNFLGWSDSADGDVLYKDAVSILNIASTKNAVVTLYAVWEKASYSISFFSDGKSILVKELKYDESISNNSEIVDLINAVMADGYKEGYSFDGWSSEIPNNMPAQNLVLSAKWKINQYTITFDTVGGNAVRPITQDYGTSIIEPANPTKPGYTFDKWSSAIPTTMPSEDLTITALWIANTYTVKFNKNDDKATGSMDDLNATYDQKFYLSSNAFSKLGYEFSGWSETANGNVKYANGVEVSNLTTKENGEVTLYAVWTPITYTVKLLNSDNSLYKEISATYDQNILLPTLKQEGYKFNGWKLNDTLYTESTSNLTTVKDAVITLVADFTIREFLFTVDYNNEQEDYSILVKYGEKVDTTHITLVPSLGADAQFDYWSLNGEEFDFATFTMPANEVTVVAMYQNIYTITFDTVGGTTVSAIRAVAGTTIDINNISEPTKTGYRFDGWNIEIPATMPANNTTITAKWIANTYVLVFDANDSDVLGSMDNQTATYDVDFNISKNKYSKVGYEFTGWAESSDGAVKFVDNALVIDNLCVDNGSVKTLYAKWSPITYKVTLINSDGSIHSVKNVKYDENITLPTLEEEGYTFNGWNYNGTKYTNSTKNLTSTAGAELELKADFTVNNYTISFDLQGGTGVESSVTYPFGTDLSDLKLTPIKTGYTFLGWSPDVPTIMPAKNQTVTAQWQANTYSVVFNPNVNSYTGEMRNQHFTYGVSQNLTANNFARIGYKFAGWSTSSNGTVVYNDNVSVSNLVDKNGGSIELYAVWTPITYKVVFNGNGSTKGTMNDLTLTYDVSANITLNAFEKEGYSFGGWSTSKDGEKVYDNGANILNLTNESAKVITLYALWNVNEYTIKFDSNEGSEVDSITTNYGESIILPETSKEGYQFIGWYTDKECTKLFNLSSMPSYDLTLYAKWEILTFDVTFNYGSSHKVNASTSVVENIEYGNLICKTISYSSLLREGYDVVITVNGDDISSSSIYNSYTIKASDVFEITYKVKQYRVNLMIEGKVFYFDTLDYGTEFSYNDAIESLHDTARVLKELEDIVNLFAVDKDTAGGLLYAFHTQYGEFIVSLGNNELSAKYAYLMQEFMKAFGGQADDMKNACINILTPLTIVYASYESLGKVYPQKLDHVFVGWFLGSDTTYMGDSEGAAYKGYVPASIDGICNIVAKFEKPVYDIEYSEYDSKTYTIDWSNSWEQFVEDYLVKYYGYSTETADRFDVSFSVSDISSGLLFEHCNTSKTNYTFNVPGYYEILVIANVVVKDQYGHVIAQFDTQFTNNKTISIKVAPKLDNPNLDVTEGNYYYIINEGDIKYLYLFTGAKYNFSSQFSIENKGDGNYNEYIEFEVTETGTSINTKQKPGEFILNNGTNIYYATVLPTVSTFSFGEDLSQYQYTINNSSSSVFLNDSKEDAYRFGVKVDGLTITDYVNNGVKIDTNILLSNGSKVDTTKYENYLTYKFRKFDGNSWSEITDASFAVYNEEHDTWEFNISESELEKDLTYEMEISIGYYYLPKVFYNENGESIIPSIKLRFKLNDCLNVYSHETLKYVFSNLNYQNGINIHSNIDARLDKIELYTPEAVALDANGVSANPIFSLLASIDDINTNNKYELEKPINYSTPELGFYLKQKMRWANYWVKPEDRANYETDDDGDIMFDGSALNFTNWELGYALAKAYLDYLGEDGILDFDGAEGEEYFEYLTTLRTGNVYFRGGIVPADFDEDYQINGNYFEVDGSNLPYMSINSISNLSKVNGYEVAHCMSSIFTYAVSCNTSNDNPNAQTANTLKHPFEHAYSERYIRNEGTISFNNLLITGNTSDTQEYGDDLTDAAIELMNRNSSGYSGITSAFGGNFKTNNSVVRGATLGIAVRHEGQLNMDYTSVISSWANGIYLHDAGDVTITNSYIKDSGGSAIYAEDTESNCANTKDEKGNFTQTSNVIRLDINTKIDNFISGAEGYFNANGMAGQVMLLKGQLEPELISSGLTSLLTVKNYLGLETEMLNFTIQTSTAGANADANYQDPTKKICYIRLIMTGADGKDYVHSTALNPAGSANQLQVVPVSLTPSYQMASGYCLLSYYIPGNSNVILGLEVKPK